MDQGVAEPDPVRQRHGRAGRAGRVVGSRTRNVSAPVSTRRPAIAPVRSLPPSRSAALEHDDLDVVAERVTQRERGGETGDAAADDRDVTLHAVCPQCLA